jgi:hypothetical protein
VQSVNAIYKASDLSPEYRRVVEALLSRGQNENVSVRAFSGNIIQPAPTGEVRVEAFRRLRARIDETAERDAFMVVVYVNAPRGSRSSLPDESRNYRMKRERGGTNGFTPGCFKRG